MAFLIGIVAKSASYLVKSVPSSLEESVRKAASNAAGRTIRASLVLLRLETLKQKSDHSDIPDLVEQEFFEQAVLITQNTFQQEFSQFEHFSREDIAVIISEAARRIHGELKNPKNIAKLVNVYLKELEEAANLQKDLIQEFISEIEHETKKRDAIPSWRRRRAVLTYYLGQGTIPVAIIFLIIAAFIHAYWNETHRDYDEAFVYLTMLVVFVVMLRFWFWLETDLFPHAPEGSKISRKAYLTQPQGYFDKRIRFAIWFAITLLTGALILVVTLLTIQMIGDSQDLSQQYQHL